MVPLEWSFLFFARIEISVHTPNIYPFLQFPVEIQPQGAERLLGRAETESPSVIYVSTAELYNFWQSRIAHSQDPVTRRGSPVRSLFDLLL